MREVTSTLVQGLIGMLLLIALIYWVLYWPVAQGMLWAWVVDLWHPSAWPIILSAWYWLLPVISSVLWGACALHQTIAGEKQPMGWFWFNVALWSPLWFYFVVALILWLLSMLALVSMWRKHESN